MNLEDIWRQDALSCRGQILISALAASHSRQQSGPMTRPVCVHKGWLVILSEDEAVFSTFCLSAIIKLHDASF